MNIAFILHETWEEEYVTTRLTSGVKFYPVGTNVADVDPATEVVSVFIHSAIPARTLAKLPNLKLIATRSTGFDHIDLNYCREHGITVCNVPSYGERTVAEYAFALLLGLTRKVREGSERLQEKMSSDLDDLRGMDLFGKTMGIVGTGKIGRNAGNIAHGFGMKLLAYDMYPNEAWAKEVGAEYVDLKTIYGQSDVLTFHTPYNKETHHIFNKESLAQIKRGVVVVNTARGALAETEALLEGLDSGVIAGAALDVYEHEELVGKDAATMSDEEKQQAELLEKLLTHKKVIASAHNAFNTHEALHRILDTTIETVKSYMDGQELATVVK